MPVRAKPLPTVDRLAELFDYEPATGLVVRKVSVNYNAPAGSVVGNASNRRGYKRVHVDGVLLFLHRVAWALHYRAWPDADLQIDHVNGDGGDNRLENLRLVTNKANSQNRQKVLAKSGLLGVSQSNRKKPWVAQISINGKQTCLGYFSDPNEAAAAYASARKERDNG